jgi:hypothetical protein
MTPSLDILRRYNSNLFGYSTESGTVLSEGSFYNVAIPGSKAMLINASSN